MKLYRIQSSLDRRAERNASQVKAAGLKKASGGEDLVILTAEALNSFNRDKEIRNREEELRRLALRHVNDLSPELAGLEHDAEFMKAERCALMHELEMRIILRRSGKKLHRVLS